MLSFSDNEVQYLVFQIYYLLQLPVELGQIYLDIYKIFAQVSYFFLRYLYDCF